MEEGPNVGRLAIDPPYAQEWIYARLTSLRETLLGSGCTIDLDDPADFTQGSDTELPYLRAIGQAFLTVLFDVVVPFITQFQISYLLFRDPISISSYLTRIIGIIKPILPNQAKWLGLCRITGAAGMLHAIYVMFRRLCHRYGALTFYTRALLTIFRRIWCWIADKENEIMQKNDAPIPSGTAAATSKSRSVKVTGSRC